MESAAIAATAELNHVWTGADKLRHTEFITLRDDQALPKVVRDG
jgi:hypothetical protein